MEGLDNNKYKKLKKRKLAESLDPKREEQFKKLFDALKDQLLEFEKHNERLQDELSNTQAELKKTREEFLENNKAKDKEILRLKHLLAEETEKNKSTAAGSPDATAQVIVQNPNPISPARKTPESNSTMKLRSRQKAVVPCSNSVEEARGLDFSRRDTCISGNATNERSIAHFQSLVESLVHMKISINSESERFSLSVSHEASGYSFTLTWLEESNGGEWMYELSSLGTLERIAVYWMKENIRFSMRMCFRFFEQLSCIINQGG
ncbi:hypothetical protein ACP70R_031423 [Stipagrostis hirtigluma subsp. patula]